MDAQKSLIEQCHLLIIKKKDQELSEEQPFGWRQKLYDKINSQGKLISGVQGVLYQSWQQLKNHGIRKILKINYKHFIILDQDSIFLKYLEIQMKMSRKLFYVV